MFISCGDALVDLFSQPADSAGGLTLGGHVGGSPLNVAVGLARLNNPAAFLCKNSRDFIGQRIYHYLQTNGVDTQWVIPTKHNSTLAMVEKNDDGSANYAFYIENTADVSLQTGDLPEAFPDSVRVIHFGSYSTVVEPTASALLAMARRESRQMVISYDPNIRLSIEADVDLWRSRFAEFSAVASFIKASDEDIAALFGDGKGIDEWAADCIAGGAALVAVTEGTNGATLFAADGRQTRSRPLSVVVADTVGAGDTFQAACLHFFGAQRLLKGNELLSADTDLDELASFATRAAAITCTRHGADLPTLVEVESAKL
ncbi:MAG: carbohydrate kinase [Granulosicoccus sp.]